MPTISTLNSIAIANVSSYSTRTKASISTINTVTVPSGAVTATYWYFAWGSNNGASATAVTDRITYSTWAVAANTASNLSHSHAWLHNTWLSDTTTYWYVAWWDRVVTADRTTFSTSATAANTASNLSQARGYHTSCLWKITSSIC
mgnify:FL=1